MVTHIPNIPNIPKTNHDDVILDIKTTLDSPLGAGASPQNVNAPLVKQETIDISQQLNQRKESALGVMKSFIRKAEDTDNECSANLDIPTIPWSGNNKSDELNFNYAGPHDENIMEVEPTLDFSESLFADDKTENFLLSNRLEITGTSAQMSSTPSIPGPMVTPPISMDFSDASFNNLFSNSSYYR